MTINGSTNSNSYIIWLNAYESGYSVTNNTSTVVVELYMKRTSGSYAYNGGNYSGSITVNGSRQNYSGSLTYPTAFNQGESKKYATLTFYNIGHNSDGSKSVSINATYSANFSPTSGSASGNLTLTTIPRASNVGTSSGYVEGSTNIVINPYASFSHSVRIKFGSIQKWLQSDGTLGSNEYKFSSSNTRPIFYIPTDFYSEFTSERANGTITVYTYSGNTNIGNKSNTLTVICNPALCNPYATATVVDSYDKTIALSGDPNNIIRYGSMVLITPTITVSAQNDTKTTLQSKAIDGTIFTTDTITIANPSDKLFTLKLINSRNMSSEIIVSATGELIPYIPLTFSGNSYRPEPTTGEIEIEYSGNYFAQKFSEGGESSIVSVDDTITSDNLVFNIPSNFYETIPSLIENDRTHLLETDTYKIFVGKEAATQPHYFVTIETIGTEDTDYDSDNFIYAANYNEVDGWYISVNKASMGSSTTINLGTVTSVSNDATALSMFQNTDKSGSSVSNALNLSWVYREKGTEDWITGGTLTPDIDIENNTYSGSESLGTIFDYRKQYEFMIIYSDKILDGKSSIFNVSRGFPVFWWSEDAVHIMNELYCNSDHKVLVPYVLYNGSQQFDNDNNKVFELFNDDCENYERIDVVGCFMNPNDTGVVCLPCYPDYDHGEILSAWQMGGYIRGIQFKMYGKKFEALQVKYSNLQSTPSGESFYLLKVIGYK